MAGILRVDQANVDYIYAKTAGGKVYIPGHVLQVVTSQDSTAIQSTSTSYANLWTFSINNVRAGSKIVIILTYSNLWESSEANNFRMIRSSDSVQVGYTQGQRSYSASGWAHVYPTLMGTDSSPSVGTNSYILQAKGASTAGTSPQYYYNYPAVASDSYSFVTLFEVAQ